MPSKSNRTAPAQPTRTGGSKRATANEPESKPVRRSPGRSRSDSSRIAILNAALSLLKTQTLQQITIEAIAREANVGKATIYRWWSSKAAIVIEAFVQNHVLHTPMPGGLSGRAAITKHLHLLIEQYSGWPGRVVAQILAEGQADPEVLREFREHFFHGRRLMVREVLERGRQQGEFRTDSDLQSDILYAPIYLRLLLQHQPLDQAFADTLSAALMTLLCVEPAHPVAKAHSSPPTGSSQLGSRPTFTRATTKAK
jgi:AcrR family transcriptional regulator